MPNPTFAEAFEELRQAVASKQPDPHFAPLLALVQEECWDCKSGIPVTKNKNGIPGIGEHSGWGCQGTGFLSRLSYWEQADSGAWEGALAKAVRFPDANGEVHYSVLRLSENLLGILCFPDDTRIQATQAVTAWAEKIG